VAHGGNVMAKRAQMYGQTKRQPLVKEKPHLGAGVAAMRWAASSRTNTCANSRQAFTSSMVNRGNRGCAQDTPKPLPP
jgi:hypothetical protein